MNKLLVIITRNADDMENEWNLWGFNKANNIVYRKGVEYNYYATLEEIMKVGIDKAKDSILWINGLYFATTNNALPNAEQRGDFAEWLKTYRQDMQIYIAHHPPDTALDNFYPTEFVFNKYYRLDDVTSNIKICPTGSSHLNNKANFEDIFEALFLIPVDVLSFVDHKLRGLIAHIAVDVDTLRANHYDKECLQNIAKHYDCNTYQSIKTTLEILVRKNKSVRNLEELICRMRSCESIDCASAPDELSKLWCAVSTLIEEDNMKPLKDIISVFCGKDNSDTCIKTLQDSTDQYQQWVAQIFHAIDELGRLIPDQNKAY